MKVDFVFQYRIDGIVKRETILEKPEISLMLGGIAYAKVKEFTNKRTKEYKDLMDKLNVVIHGKSRWNKKIY